MQVSIKDLAVTMDLGNRGVEFEVHDAEGAHLGDFRISRATVEWCKGRTRSGNGVQVSWEQLIKWFEENA